MQTILLSIHEQRHVISCTGSLLLIGSITLGDDRTMAFIKTNKLIMTPGFFRIGNVIMPKQ